MKKICTPLLAICLASIFLLPINSCRKIEDMKITLENGKADCRQCTIQQMTQQIRFEPFGLNLTFTYNNRKDPVSITPDLFLPNYSQWLFYYDKKGRLSQSVTIHNDGTFDLWHVYLYDGQDRITGDSTYHIGQQGQRGTAADRWLTKISYDHLNRIIKETQTSPGYSYSIEYVYNNQGNLSSRHINDNGTIRVDDITGYVNVASVLLTNKIWRFLLRDYSVNSRSQPYAVNDHGLPTA
ncbi:MAG: hypothetical protein ABUL46_05740, partial [Chitinophaga rupis]